MAQFVFQLEGVLKHRQTLERQRQRIAAVEAEKVRVLETQLQHLDQQVQAMTRQVRETQLVGRLDMNYLAAHRRYMAAMQRKAVVTAQEMAAAQVKADKARADLLEEVKKRKAFEKLRERHYSRWIEEQTRREMTAQDEVATQMSYRLLTERADVIAEGIDADAS